MAPDTGRIRVAERWTDRLHCPLAIIHKRRDAERPNEVSVHEVAGDVAGRTCVIIDMIDTGGTLVREAQALTDRGATQVIAAATHGVFSDDAVERLEQAGLAQLVITDTLPDPASIPSGGLVVLSNAPPLARAISEVFLEGSVTSLFEGES